MSAPGGPALGRLLRRGVRGCQDNDLGRTAGLCQTPLKLQRMASCDDALAEADGRPDADLLRDATILVLMPVPDPAAGVGEHLVGAVAGIGGR